LAVAGAGALADLIGQTDMDDRTLARFFSFVNKNGPLAANNPELGRCWIWTGGLNRGYGIFWAFGTSHRAHKFAYRVFVDEVPPDLPHLDHFACDRTDCVNYQHVRPDTARGNALRSGNIAAQNRAKDECPAGHDYAIHGRVNEAGSRECTLCVRKRQREAKKAKRDAERGHEISRGTETHCANGHPWTAETTYLKAGRKTPECKICRRESQATSRAAKKRGDAAA
jgi:hypothetical protein